MIPDKRDIAIAIAWRLYGTPYIYGGNDPYLDGGLDCSGFIRYVLRRVGVIPLAGDWTAQGFYSMFKDRQPEIVTSILDDKHLLQLPSPYAGCLAFYGSPQEGVLGKIGFRSVKIQHVMLCLNESECIGSINGDKWCSNEHTARCRQAMVDIRPINYRTDLVTVIDPFRK